MLPAQQPLVGGQSELAIATKANCYTICSVAAFYHIVPACTRVLMTVQVQTAAQVLVAEIAALLGLQAAMGCSTPASAWLVGTTTAWSLMPWRLPTWTASSPASTSWSC